MRSMVAAIASGAVALILGVCVLYVKQERHAASEIAALKAQVAQLREMQLTEDSEAVPLKQLAAMVARARNAEVPPASDVASDLEGRTVAAKGAEGTPGSSLPPITMEQSREFVDAAYEEETPDSSWSLPASRQLEALVQRSLPSRGALRSVACRATLCRIEISLASEEDLTNFGFSAFRDWPGSIFLANETKDRNGLQATYYASREGTEPPLNGGP